MPHTNSPPIESPTTRFAFDHRVPISLAALAYLMMLGSLLSGMGEYRHDRSYRSGILCCVSITKSSQRTER